MKMQSIAALSISVLATLLVEGCAAPQSPPVFPNPQAASPAGGTFVNVDNLRNVAVGLNKDQMYDLIGPPQFHEWFVGNHVWNYLFDFRRGNEVVSCQYQVQFDKHMQVSGTYWRDPACADLLKMAPATNPVTPVPPPLTRLDGDISFDTARASLTPAGQAQLNQLIADAGGIAIGLMTVNGYTDSVGTDAYNQDLSERRAKTVLLYLQSHGLRADRVVSRGYGKADPISSNATENGRARNRRVEILLQAHTN